MYGVAESEKDGEPRNQVPEEGFESEEGLHEIFNSLPNIFRIELFRVELCKIIQESVIKSA